VDTIDSGDENFLYVIPRWSNNFLPISIQGIQFFLREMDIHLLFQELENNPHSPKVPQIIASINQYLGTSNFQISRPLFQAIPQLCAFLFGNATKKGYFHTPAKDRWIQDFLKPNSALLIVLLSLEQDTTSLYSISADYLPVYYANTGPIKTNVFVTRLVTATVDL
jgi:hypothetical protein